MPKVNSLVVTTMKLFARKAKHDSVPSSTLCMILAVEDAGWPEGACYTLGVYSDLSITMGSCTEKCFRSPDPLEVMRWRINGIL